MICVSYVGRKKEEKDSLLLRFAPKTKQLYEDFISNLFWLSYLCKFLSAKEDEKSLEDWFCFLLFLGGGVFAGFFS